jgi:hypothetical protein
MMQIEYNANMGSLPPQCVGYGVRANTKEKKMMQENFNKRKRVQELQQELEESHTSLENFYHRSMQYVQMILANKEMYKLDKLVVDQLESIVELGDSL